MIVGAGSAGCVLANRLSADPRHRVLLLEAGGKARNPLLHIPIGFGKTMHSPHYSWNFETEPDLGGRRRKWPRGKVLGGSSTINGLLYIRGQREDYDGWRQLGCTGWSYDDVLPYYRRSQDSDRADDPLHGSGGPLRVEHPQGQHPVSSRFVDACVQAGIPYNDDPNGAVQEGVAYAPVTMRRGVRCSAATAFLDPVRTRGNLHIVTGALVEGVDIADGRATAVRYRVGGVAHRAVALEEIILSAGAIGSPQLLMLSGIGDGDALAAVGVEARVQSPDVGRNLQDHLASMVIASLTPSATFNEVVRSPAILGQMWRYATARGGMFASAAAHVVVFCRSDTRLASPDIQLHMLPASTSDYAGGDLDRFPGLTCAPCQLRPESRGEVTLRSADPAAPPVIRPNYLSAPADQEALVAGIRISRRILAQPALADIVEREVMPGADVEASASLLASAAMLSESVYHPVGTCRMGGDPASVVDPRLRVRGVAGLRVADASIMPRLISGNTNAPAIMIGEKAAAMILEDARG
ncbi:GMC family oxidoreductase [Novosphingobium aquae]|uniref:GMC family oxidoreductase N-terminal domain-containing protein n=1 Tax=Novosphingobium aquae TaxID=3133435 RepID=A0ABU8SA65_9SPHN